jgi:hypothetical protein
MQGKKHASAKLPIILLGSPPRATSSGVKSQHTDSDTSKFTRKYLDLADKALLTTHRENEEQTWSSRRVHLRLEPEDGSPAKDYRIRDGEIEVRILAAGIHLADREWRRLTPEEIAYHVKNNTVVARWLEARLGWRRVLRKCVQAPEDQSKAA